MRIFVGRTEFLQSQAVVQRSNNWKLEIFLSKSLTRPVNTVIVLYCVIYNLVSTTSLVCLLSTRCLTWDGLHMEIRQKVGVEQKTDSLLDTTFESQL